MNINIAITKGTCESNSLLATKIHKYLETNGHKIVDNIEESDSVILVGCAFNNFRERQTISKINKILKYDSKQIIITGCFPSINNQIKNHSRMLNITLDNITELDRIFDSKISISHISTKKIISRYYGKKNEECIIEVSQGCAHNCSYCAIKKAKGDIKSRTIQAIVKDITDASESGTTKFTLLSDDNGSYGIDIGTDFSKLLNQICKIKNTNYKVLNFHPYMLNKFINEINTKSWQNISEIIIPLQSTSNRILKLMNRQNYLEYTINNIGIIRKANPKIKISTEIIFGFPSETLEETKSHLRYIKYFDEIKFLPFSKKKGTKAANLDGQLSADKIIERIKIIKDAIASKSSEKTNMCIGF